MFDEAREDLLHHENVMALHVRVFLDAVNFQLTGVVKASRT